MISLEEYNLKYNQLLNSDTCKEIEKKIDINIQKDILQKIIEIHSNYNIQDIKKIMKILSLKYYAYGWAKLEFSVSPAKVDTCYLINYKLYSISEDDYNNL